MSQLNLLSIISILLKIRKRNISKHGSWRPTAEFAFRRSLPEMNLVRRKNEVVKIKYRTIWATVFCTHANGSNL